MILGTVLEELAEIFQQKKLEIYNKLLPKIYINHPKHK